MIAIRFVLLALCASFLALSSAFVVPKRSIQARKHATISPQHFVKQSTTTPLSMSTGQDNTPETKQESNLPMLLDIGTKGGALFLSFLLFLVPLLVYQVVTNLFGVDGIEAGKWIGVGFTAFTTILWVSSYIFRVATKDMTYAKQLKDYENAVIAKRLEELDEDEVQALVEDIERDDF